MCGILFLSEDYTIGLNLMGVDQDSILFPGTSVVIRSKFYNSLITDL